MQNNNITVLGAGAIGVSTALHLQQRGWHVTLIDRSEPAEETSFGNAGVINIGSMVPINSPAMHAHLASYLFNNKPQLRYSKKHILKNLSWVLQFLRASSGSNSERTAKALYQLTGKSLEEHKALMQRTGNMHRLSEVGWLKVFRTGSGFDPDSFDERQLLRFGIDVELLDASKIRALEPALQPIYSAGYLLSAGAGINNPGMLIKEYAQQFIADGGTLQKIDITLVEAKGSHFSCHAHGKTLDVEKLVIAAGPWSGDLLAMLGYKVPLGFERGYHVHYHLPTGVNLNRSVHDTQAGFVMGPMEQGLRITTGVELNHRDAPSNYSQLRQVLPLVKQAINLGEQTDQPIWRGSRPTLPDSMPIIGSAPAHANLWMAFGHNHIGLMTGPITGRLLAEHISGESSDADLAPFTPARYLRH